MADEYKLEELEELLSSGPKTEKDEAASGTQENKNKTTRVRITPDKKEAWLYLERPEVNKTYTREDLVAYLDKEGVKTGYILSNITAMAKKGVYEREIKVAMMIACEEGHDGFYEYLFDYEHSSRIHPKIRDDGSVDYQSMQLLENVKKDQMIAKYHRATIGKVGYLVDGTEIKPQPTKELPPLKGTGFSNRLIETEYYAETSGKLEYKNDQINIRTVHEIPGDLTMIIGKVDFEGDVVIKGNVESGVIVRVGKTLTVEGTVENADLYAVGDIMIKRGIQGSNKASVVSTEGSVYADFIEHTTVQAAENVESNTILNSDVRANGKVILTGNKGLVLGGYTHGRKGIEAVNAGNIVEVRTILHAGLESADHEKNAELMKKDTILREKLAEILTTLTALVKQRKIRELNPSEERKLLTLVSEKDILARALKENIASMEELRGIVEDASKAEICIYEKLFRGVVISFDAQNQLIENNTCYMSYRNIGGVIVGSVVIRN